MGWCLLQTAALQWACWFTYSAEPHCEGCAGVERQVCVLRCPYLLLLPDSLCKSLPALPLPRTSMASIAFCSRSSWGRELTKKPCAGS